jgi:hypothetical protein
MFPIFITQIHYNIFPYAHAYLIVHYLFHIMFMVMKIDYQDNIQN